MGRKFNVVLDTEKVERLRDAARRRAVVLKCNQTWVDLLRLAVDRFLADETARKTEYDAVGGSL